MRISRCRRFAGRERRRRYAVAARYRHETHENTTTTKRKFSSRAFRVFVVFVAAVWATPAVAQTLTQRGFLEATLFTFPQTAPNDRTRLVVDFLAREEAFFKPAPWLQFAAGIDVRVDSHDQVEERWRFDVSDRGAERPHVSLRRASATFTRGPLTV